MSSPAAGSVGWIEVATPDPDAAERFYGELFGWRIAADEAAADAGIDYRIAVTASGQGPIGGVTAVPDAGASHAVFSIVVPDVAAACASAERLGGTVVEQHAASGTGPANAYLRDPAGNLFGVFTPPAGG